MYEFKYHRPGTVRQAANLLAKNEDAKVIAGGHTLVPVMKQRLASPPHLVDLSHVEGLNAIEMQGRSLSIGATVGYSRSASSSPTVDYGSGNVFNESLNASYRLGDDDSFSFTLYATQSGAPTPYAESFDELTASLTYNCSFSFAPAPNR